MVKINGVIQQMSDEDAGEFLSIIQSGKGDKFLLLFSLLRKGLLAEKEIEKELGVASGAYYTLKSRLLARVQDFLAKKMPESTNTDLIKTINNIPHLIYNSPRETAVAHLIRMEKDFLANDQPLFMAKIYHALKRLHIHSPKFYDYDQKYNKHLAYAVAIHKAEEILASFAKSLGEYSLSKDKKYLDIFPIYKMKMHNNAVLYPSHRLKVFENILYIQYALFLPILKEAENDRSVDDLLSETEKIFSENPDEPLYQYLQNVVDFLWFEYYRKHNIEKKTEGYYKKVYTGLPTLLRNNFIVFPSSFLNSVIERHLKSGNELKLFEVSDFLASGYVPYSDDVAGYINYTKFRAVSSFYAGKYTEAANLINELMKDVTFLPFLHAEIELRLFLVVCYLFAAKSESAELLLKNIQRKLREMKNEDYAQAVLFAKLLGCTLGANDKGLKLKMISLKDKFLQANSQNTKMLDFLRLDDVFITRLSKAVK